MCQFFISFKLLMKLFFCAIKLSVGSETHKGFSTPYEFLVG